MNDLCILDGEEVTEWLEASGLHSMDDMLHATTRGQIGHCPAGFLLALEVTLGQSVNGGKLYNDDQISRNTKQFIE